MPDKDASTSSDVVNTALKGVAGGSAVSAVIVALFMMYQDMAEIKSDLAGIKSVEKSLSASQRRLEADIAEINRELHSLEIRVVRFGIRVEDKDGASRLYMYNPLTAPDGGP